MQLRYNPATGVWMPAPELRPNIQEFSSPQPLLRNSPQFRAIPPMPALPRRPAMRMPHLSGRVASPTFSQIPNRPVISQAAPPRMPERIRQKAKLGQYALTDTIPNPSVVPKPNLPRMARYNTEYMKRGNKSIERKMFTSNGIPDGPRFLRTTGIRKKLTPSDLGINATKGSNSALVGGIGNHLGRTVGNNIN